MMGILLDAISQWLILGVSHPGAALVVGPVLIVGPYSLARALSNRFARARTTGASSQDGRPAITDASDQSRHDETERRRA